MRKESYVLQHPTGQTYRYITRAEGERLVERKQAVRLRAKRGAIRFRLIPVPEPSDSREDSPALTAFDMRAAAGWESRGAMYASRRRVKAWMPTIRVAPHPLAYAGAA